MNPGVAMDPGDNTQDAQSGRRRAFAMDDPFISLQVVFLPREVVVVFDTGHRYFAQRGGHTLVDLMMTR